MKTRILYVLMSCLTISIYANSSNAQAALNKAAFFTNAAERSYGETLHKTVVNTKIKKAFIKEFGEKATGEWSVTGNNFLNHFYIDGRRANALFNKNGRLIYTVIYGTETLLPADLKALVQSEYQCHDITTVFEVMQQGRHIWVVQLQNNDEVITARIENGELEQTQQFARSK